MSRKRFKPEQIINLLREAEVGLSQGRKIGVAPEGEGMKGGIVFRFHDGAGGAGVLRAALDGTSFVLIATPLDVVPSIIDQLVGARYGGTVFDVASLIFQSSFAPISRA